MENNILMITIAFILTPTFLFLSIIYNLLSHKTSKPQQHTLKHSAKSKLPPGTMGWPCIGETLKLYSQDPNIFFSTKLRRYGEIFKTHILGCPCVMVASPEATRFVLVTHSHLFKPTFPKSKERLIGPSALFFHQGRYHTQLRKLLQNSLAPKNLQKRIVDIEAIAISSLESWASGEQHVVHTFHEMKKFAFDVGILSIFGQLLDCKYREELYENYSLVNKGYNSFPTNIPGTAYQKASMARKRLNQILSDIIYEREEKKMVENDLLQHLLDFKDENGQVLSKDEISDNIIGVLFAAQDTTASILTWILKYLHDDPKLLEAVKEEQMRIFEETDGGKKPLSWTQTRNMPFTHKVILESLRMASIISFTFREAVTDVEYKGYIIPKGWKVLPLFRNIHHNPEFFSHAQTFDPSRFEIPPRANTFMPFGKGLHSCPGHELAKLEILILIHHLVTKFRWKVVGSESGIECVPFPVPKNGLPTRFFKSSHLHQ